MSESSTTWRQVTLGELCAEGGGSIQTGPFGSQLHAADYVLSGIPSVMPLNIGDNIIVEEAIARITEADATRLQRYRLAEGDIVYSRRGDVEKRALVRSEHDGWLCGTGCLRVRPGDRRRNDSRFISYLLGVPSTREWISRHAVGATMPNLNTGILSRVPLTVPDIKEQRLIADVLGALDDKVAANAKLADTLALLASARYEQAKQGAESLALLSDLVTTQYGLTTSANELRGPKFLRVTDINKKPWIEWDKTPSCTVGESDLRKYRVRRGDILVARMADPGKAAFVDDDDREAVFASYLVRLKPHDPLAALYIYYFLRSEEYLRYADGAMQGSVQKNMNARVIVATEINLPGRDAIAGFDAAVTPLRASMRAALQENEKLVATRDALLPQLMSGKLRVKDAEKVLEGVL